MDFNIKVRRSEDKVIVLEMSGKLREGEPVLLLREIIKTQLQNGARHVLLDLSAVSSIDSRGLGEMISSLTTVTNQGGSLKITGLDKRSTAVVQMTGLEPVLNTPSQIAPQSRKTRWKNIGLAVAIALVVSALYWVAVK